MTDMIRSPEISIIMLTYNRENLIGRAIESVLVQTFTNFELIIVDNGSTDQSGSIADGYSERDKRIRVIHKERGNIGSGRNAGLREARGVYVAFIDDDDWCEPDFIEFLYELILKYHSDISICGSMKEGIEGTSEVGVPDKPILMDAEQSIITLMWRKRFNTGFPTKLIARRFFSERSFAETGRYDDISLMYKILAKAEKVVSYGLPKYHVFRHGGNNSSATTIDRLITSEYLDIYRKAYRERTEWLCIHFPNQIMYWWYFDWSFEMSMCHKIIENNLIDCQSHLSEMRQELLDNDNAFMNSPYIRNFEIDWMKAYILEG